MLSRIVTGEYLSGCFLYSVYPFTEVAFIVMLQGLNNSGHYLSEN